MIDRAHPLPLKRQAEVLKLSRSTLYYRPRPIPAADLAIMRRLDELHLDYGISKTAIYNYCPGGRNGLAERDAEAKSAQPS